MSVSIRWFTNACFEIKSSEISIVTDPCIKCTACKTMSVEDFDTTDLVLISHIHWDHITELPDLVEKFKPLICCGALSAIDLAQWLNCNTSYLFPMFPDQELNFGKTKIKLLYGRHCDVGSTAREQNAKSEGHPFLDAYPGIRPLQHIGSMDMSSYLITFNDGFKVLFWGGNLSIQQEIMLSGLKPDVAIMQYSKQDPQQLVNLIDAIGPKFVIPHHMDLRKTRDQYQGRLDELAALYKGTLLLPDNRETLSF